MRVRLLAVGLVLLTAGYFGPWIPHKTAALTVTGLELAEFAKFFPQVQSGTAVPHREWFYLPLVAAFILGAFLSAQTNSRLLRWATPVCAVALLLAMLLPYSIVEGVRAGRFPLDPQQAAQFRLVVAGSALILASPLARVLPLRARSALIALLALGGIAPAVWQWALFRPLVADLYGTAVGLGWGMITSIVGAGWLVVAAALKPCPIPTLPGSRDSSTRG